jgi:prepilin-type N-terminal cleavage/methylation domain-containing protein
MKTRSAFNSNPVVRATRAGFTLLEMMVVIGIIGLLTSFLIPNIVDAMARASIAAEKGNMQEMQTWMQLYRNSHNQSLPTESGQKFILKLWKDGTIERSEKNAKRFFSAGENYTEYMASEGFDPGEISVVEYLTDWDSIGPGYINYAAFDPQGDRTLRRKLKTAPSTVTILANATFAHRNAIVYMTADGDIRELNIQNLIDEGILTKEDVDSGVVPVGAGSPIEQLRTVTNN